MRWRTGFSSIMAVGPWCGKQARILSARSAHRPAAARALPRMPAPAASTRAIPASRCGPRMDHRGQFGDHDRHRAGTPAGAATAAARRGDRPAGCHAWRKRCPTSPAPPEPHDEAGPPSFRSGLRLVAGTGRRGTAGQPRGAGDSMAGRCAGRRDRSRLRPGPPAPAAGFRRARRRRRQRARQGRTVPGNPQPAPARPVGGSAAQWNCRKP